MNTFCEYSKKEIFIKRSQSPWNLHTLGPTRNDKLQSFLLQSAVFSCSYDVGERIPKVWVDL